MGDTTVTASQVATLSQLVFRRRASHLEVLANSKLGVDLMLLVWLHSLLRWRKELHSRVELQPTAT